MAVVDGVEPGERREEPDVCLGDGLPDEVALVREAFAEPVESGEQTVVRLLVGGLRAGETAAGSPSPLTGALSKNSSKS